jgi:hypothetical protein
VQTRESNTALHTAPSVELFPKALYGTVYSTSATAAWGIDPVGAGFSLPKMAFEVTEPTAGIVELL